MTRRLYILAGEPSGDRLGGALMPALSELMPVEFRGVGGQTMTRAGLSSRFDMTELSVMGLTEVLPRLPKLVRRIRETAADVIAWKPDALVTIDSPDFTLRVASRVRRALPDLKIIHYVAPSVWAWRPGRAAKMARYVDHVLALLPFEPPFMHAAGMTCDFVGHPVAVGPRPTEADKLAFRAHHGLADKQPVLLLAPGSRRGEVRRLLPDFKLALARLQRRHPDLTVVTPMAETVEKEVRTSLEGLDRTILLAAADTTDEEKRIAFAAADVALCASGTIVLELAAAGTPMVAAYRTTWLTAQIVRRVIRINTANLVNLIAGRTIVPEFLQEFLSPPELADALASLLTDASARVAQTDAFEVVLGEMGRGGKPPSQRAAESVLSVLEGRAVIPHDIPDQSKDALGPDVRHVGRR